MLPVLIGSHPGSLWLKECVASIIATTDRPIVVHTTGGYEPNALRTGCELFERFVFLQDSTQILHRDFWKHIDAIDGEAWLSGWPPMFMGIHNSEKLAPHLPAHRLTKAETIDFEAHLPSLMKYETIWPNATDHNPIRQENKHGRNNLVIGVPGMWEKWKGSWA